MTRINSPRYNISYPDPTVRDEAPDVPGDLKRLVDGIEVSAMYGHGTFAVRPAFGIQGRYYFVTDRGELHYDTGAAWINLLNREIDYVEVTSNQTVDSADNQASPVSLLDFGFNTFTGQKVLLEFFCPKLDPSLTASTGFVARTGVQLYEATIDRGTLAEVEIYKDTANQKDQRPIEAKLEFTPGSGSRNYLIMAWVAADGGSTAGDAIFKAGNGSGINVLRPMFARMSYI